MSIRYRHGVIGTAGLALLLALGACGGNAAPATTATGEASPTATTAAGGTLTVFAAASLRQTFGELGPKFEAAHPGVNVSFNFGGSSDLVAQLDQGAPGDVFASADENNMKKAVDAGIVTGTPTPFATNTLTIVTAPGNPKNVSDLKDLATKSAAGTTVVICAPPVPCGSATKKVEQASGVTIKAVSEEQSVTDVLGKVTSGQADAGLVYVTDATGAGDKVATVTFPESKDAVNIYPIAALKNATDAATAQAFVDFVTGPEGKTVLSEAGFGAP
ncbi:molybdate transport system substrate-binding protein [Kineosphaera limosa]|uniref:Molybdate ABC transporter substrate-binding protein n=1 Tax=Kineosphaera limosa NBRC 100340 TaxID=1184609 RepID=K6XA00_9MICO|nr:molybdate ABC transporter substrate-binding protein [Kineosphaera limosa]NYD99705.1 molybdate transport system substrate-binding protein [Kineosphaera limosa]GAB95659.1 molybdate ABC transporter substrate-binding protein [Kineosphaera limosa NBRC 100340]